MGARSYPGCEESCGESIWLKIVTNITYVLSVSIRRMRFPIRELSSTALEPSSKLVEEIECDRNRMSSNDIFDLSELNASIVATL